MFNGSPCHALSYPWVNQWLHRYWWQNYRENVQFAIAPESAKPYVTGKLYIYSATHRRPRFPIPFDSSKSRGNLKRVLEREVCIDKRYNGRSEVECTCLVYLPKDCGWLSIHSQSSPSKRILVWRTAMCVFSGKFKIASTTFGTTSFSFLQEDTFIIFIS